MTPLDVIQGRIVKISRSGTTRMLLRNVRLATLWTLAVAVFLVGMFLVTNMLYLVIGGWGIGIGLVVTLGTFLGAIVTAFEAP